MELEKILETERTLFSTIGAVILNLLLLPDYPATDTIISLLGTFITLASTCCTYKALHYLSPLMINEKNWTEMQEFYAGTQKWNTK